MINTSRRDFLRFGASLVVLAAVPVVGTAVAPVATVILSPQVIADEMARQLFLAGARGVEGVHTEQSHVDLEIPNDAKTVPVEIFVERYLVPAARVLAQRAPRVCGTPILPNGVEVAAIGESNGVKVRYLVARDILWDTYIHRFDVLHA